MKKILIIFVGVLFLLLPVLFFTIQQKGRVLDIWPAPEKHRFVSDVRFSVQSTMPGYDLAITDPSFLDYVAERIGIFGKDAIVSPKIYRGTPTDMTKYTVSRVRLVLEPSLSQMLVGIGGTKNMAGKGDYSLNGDTLVVHVTLVPNEPTKYPSGQYKLEDVYLRAALQVFQYARGVSTDPKDFGKSVVVFRNVQKSIEDYLYPGIIPWPIKITMNK